ncbi:hypothetical protein [Hymenobacter sp.]|jgi:predicted benzoate:H+ symporter BenE|uniref:hypothetical protein n=1 Tax=Hymenobacter sp. TaxID=1898978 RepID=UPI002EDB05B1
MEWQSVGNVLFCLGLLALVVGLLLRFRAGRWLLAALLVVFTLGALLTGDWHSVADNPDTNITPQKASRYLLWGGVVCILLGLAFRTLASKSI